MRLGLNFDVWLIEACDGKQMNGLRRTFLHEDYYFLLENNQELYYGLREYFAH